MQEGVGLFPTVDPSPAEPLASCLHQVACSAVYMKPLICNFFEKSSFVSLFPPLFPFTPVFLVWHNGH
jgi:hypothetical protein